MVIYLKSYFIFDYIRNAHFKHSIFLFIDEEFD